MDLCYDEVSVIADSGSISLLIQGEREEVHETNSFKKGSRDNRSRGKVYSETKNRLTRLLAIIRLFNKDVT